MTHDEFIATLELLRTLPTETEWVEFKLNDRGEPMYAEIGEYISAIANSLPLARRDRGYVVWGIDNTTHQRVGTDFRPRLVKVKSNQELENWLTVKLDPVPRFEFHEGERDGMRFVLLEIGSATHAPVRFEGKDFIRVGSAKKELRTSVEKERELWSLLRQPRDWSAVLIDGTSLADLDPAAVAFARERYLEKNPRLASDVRDWDDRKLLEKAKVMAGGRLTRAAVLLLGTAEAERHLSPAVAEITWLLKGTDNTDLDYHHFRPPFLLAVDQLFQRIRNPTYRYLPNATLFPVEQPTYDPWVIRETLHNALAHQDYTLASRVSVVESPGQLVVTNAGSFDPGTVDDVIRADAPPDRYRNRLLTDAMVAFNLIDTIGSGIRRMFRRQWERNFPMPDYDLTADRVQVRIPGTVIDERYTRILTARKDLELLDVIALDKVQKKQPLADTEFDSLKKKKLVEGRRPNLFVSATVAADTDSRADYIKNRSFDKAHFERMVVEYLTKFGTATRQDLDKLLLGKLSDVLDAKKKANFIANLLRGLRTANRIRVVGRGPGAKWELCKPPPEIPV